MDTLYKSAPVLMLEHKSSGTISGYFSTYDRIPDSYGDVVAKGAFDRTIAAREETGHPWPLCWNHDLNQIIGAVESIEDDEHGPLMNARFFDTPLAQEKREIVKSGVVYQFSFAYSVVDSAVITLADGTKANELRDVELFEVSIVPVPANPRAEITEVKAGKRNSASDAATIQSAIDLLQSLLADEVADEQETTSEEEPETANADASAKESAPVNSQKSQLLEFIGNMD